MEQTKITVKIYDNLLAAFNDDIARLFIKRDAFLNQVIAIETKHLISELGEKRLSTKANRYISGELKRLGTTTVNIVVDKDVAEALNNVVKINNIVRDAFINRIIWMLRGSDALLTYLDLPKFINDSEFERFIPDAMPSAPLRAIHSVQCDPLNYLRVGCEDRHECGLHLLELPEKLVAFSCWIDDYRVPGTSTYIDSNKLLEELGLMESQAFEQIGDKK